MQQVTKVRATAASIPLIMGDTLYMPMDVVEGLVDGGSFDLGEILAQIHISFSLEVPAHKMRDFRAGKYSAEMQDIVISSKP